MKDQLTITRKDSDAIFAALRAIARHTRDLAGDGPSDEVTTVTRRERLAYVIFNNIDLIHLCLTKSEQPAGSATRN